MIRKRVLFVRGFYEVTFGSILILLLIGMYICHSNSVVLAKNDDYSYLNNNPGAKEENRKNILLIVMEVL